MILFSIDKEPYFKQKIVLQGIPPNVTVCFREANESSNSFYATVELIRVIYEENCNKP